MGAETAVNLDGFDPLCDEDEFIDLIETMVVNEAPRLFAVVQEYGERADGRIAAWGMRFEDRADVVSVEGGMRMTLQCPEAALPGFRCDRHVTARLVWVNPDAATPDDDASSC